MSNLTGKTKTALNMRRGPGVQHQIIRVLPRFTPLEVLGEVGAWLRVATAGGVGFVHRDYVTLDTAVSPPPDLAQPTKTGKTTTALNFRNGPGTNHSVIRVLARDTAVTVLEELGDWLRIQTGGDAGFVHRNFVILDSEGAPDDFFNPGDSTDPHVPELPNVPLEPAESERIDPGGGATPRQKRIASAWNRYGGLLSVLSERLRIDPGVAVAVFIAESGGKGFGADGRMIIRFENHIFYSQWGRRNAGQFNQHFRFNASRRWQGHQWRPSVSQPWRGFHGNQSAEWAAFTFARSLNETAAMKSISMGGPQIMGFNYAAIGYESAQEMFAAFSAGVAHQIVGFFDFVQGPATHSRRVIALQRLDFDGFAAMYNGPGQAAMYGSIIRSLFENFKRLQAA